MSFLAICCSYFTFWYFWHHLEIKKQKLGCEWACETKKWLIIIFKKYKTKAKSNFSLFFVSHWLLRKCFFSFLIKAFANCEKLIRFHWQAFPQPPYHFRKQKKIFRVKLESIKFLHVNIMWNFSLFVRQDISHKK